jgi:hypothetical protein
VYEGLFFSFNGLLVWRFDKLAHSASGLLAVLAFITSSPEPQPDKIADDEVNNKCSKEFRPAKPKLNNDLPTKPFPTRQHSSKPNVRRIRHSKIAAFEFSQCNIVH